MRRRGEQEKALALLTELTTNHDQVQWAWVLIARLLLLSGKHQQVILLHAFLTMS